MLEAVSQSPYAELCLFILDEARPPPEPPASGLLRCLLSLDERFQRSPAFDKVAIRTDLFGMELMHVQTGRDTAGRVTFSERDATDLAASSVDVFLDVGLGELAPTARAIARYGQWRLGDLDSPLPPAIWSALRGDPTTRSTLVALQETSICTAYESHGATHPYSPRGNASRAAAKSAQFPARVIRDTYLDGRLPKLDQAAQSAVGGPQAFLPLSLFARRTMEIVASLIRKRLSRREWLVACAFERDSAGAPSQSLSEYQPIAVDSEGFWADPFPVAYDDRLFLFVEDYSYALGRARVAVSEHLGENRWSKARPIIEREFHLSYPFPFHYQGTWYLVPESGESRTVDLYRCIDFPYRWIFDRTLLHDVEAVDATLAEIDGRWWMFANVAEDGASVWDELHLFCAPSPLGPWTAHRRNPVKSDVRGARPAGRLFTDGDHWYRPAQDCSRTYGYAIVIHRIDRLDDDGYMETAVRRIEPTWMCGIEATHTWNATAGLSVIDARRRVRRLPLSSRRSLAGIAEAPTRPAGSRTSA